MTIDEAIKHCLEVAEQNEKKAEYRPRMDYYDEIESRTDCLECATDHRQLAEWLTDYKKLRSIVDACNILAVDAFAVEKLCKELKEAKRLLKVAVEDLNAAVAEVYNGGVICECCKWWESQIGECCCPDSGGCDTDYRWRYANEALKLIGEE